MRRIAAILCAALLSSGAAHALEAQGAVADLRYTFYGPDWCWQKRDINVMAVLENVGAANAEVAVSMALPDGDPAPFTTEQPLKQTVAVPAGETVRIAFTQIEVSPDAPRNVYALTLRIAVPGAEPIDIAYPVRTIRGAAVSGGNWALYVPVSFTAAWSVLIFLALCRMGGKRAWLETAAPEPEDAA